MSKKRKVLLSIGCLIAFVLLVGFLGYKIIIFRIKKDLLSVYKNAEITNITLTDIVKDGNLKDTYFLWMGDEIYDGIMYRFKITGREDYDEKAFGYADIYGNVIYDTYANIYYQKNIYDEVVNIIDFKNNYPDWYHFAASYDPINQRRIVPTHECTTYNGFKNTKSVGFDMNSYGFPGINLFVGVDDFEKKYNSYEKINEKIAGMSMLLKKADLDIQVYFIFIKNINDDVKTYDDVFDMFEENRFASGFGEYCPYDEQYYDVIKFGKRKRHSSKRRSED